MGRQDYCINKSNHIPYFYVKSLDYVHTRVFLTFGVSATSMPPSITRDSFWMKALGAEGHCGTGDIDSQLLLMRAVELVVLLPVSRWLRFTFSRFVRPLCSRLRLDLADAAVVCERRLHEGWALEVDALHAASSHALSNSSFSEASQERLLNEFERTGFWA